MSRIKKQFDLTGKVAIVTGASKGIGESICWGLAEHGAKVVVSSRKQDAVDKVASELKAAGYDAIGIEAHVGKMEHLENLVEKTKAQYGGVDILVNNAGTNLAYGPIDQMNEAMYTKIMDVNVKSILFLSNLCYPSMKERGGGSIINVASVAGLKPGLGMGVYNTSKSAAVMLTQSQALDWGPFNIRSNALCPGLVKTKLSEALWTNEKLLHQVENQLALRRMAVPDEMAGLAVFLASDASSYCTGGAFTADGGHMVS